MPVWAASLGATVGFGARCEARMPCGARLLCGRIATVCEEVEGRTIYSLSINFVDDRPASARGGGPRRRDGCGAAPGRNGRITELIGGARRRSPRGAAGSRERRMAEWGWRDEENWLRSGFRDRSRLHGSGSRRRPANEERRSRRPSRTALRASGPGSTRRPPTARCPPAPSPSTERSTSAAAIIRLAPPAARSPTRWPTPSRNTPTASRWQANYNSLSTSVIGSS